MGANRTSRRRGCHQRWVGLLATVALASVTVGCGATGSGDDVATEPVSRRTPAAATAGSGLALVVTDAGLAGVPVGTSTPRWVVAGAVAAPDGSAVYATRTVPGPGGDGFEVLRIDPRTGAEESVGTHVPGPAGIHVAAVEPGGERVALAAPGEAPDSTLILDFDPSRGGPSSKPTFEGTLEPEAYSVDRALMFAARIYDDHYHVHGLELASGEQWPTLGPDKSQEPEDMYGSVVQAALSPDRSQLATLYRDSVKPEHTAFVHLLSLENGTTVCIDLHAPFGSGPPGDEAIEWRDDGTVAVGHRDADPDRSTTATFDPAAIWSSDPQPHYHADARPDRSPPTIPSGVADTPGFRRFIALAAPPVGQVGQG